MADVTRTTDNSATYEMTWGKLRRGGYGCGLWTADLTGQDDRAEELGTTFKLKELESG